MAVTRPEQEESGEDAGKPPIAVLKRMHGQKDNDKNADAQQRMQSGISFSAAVPVQQSIDVARRIERAGSLEDDTQLAPIGIEGGYVIGQGFPSATMALVLGAVLQQITMELAQHIPRKRDLVRVGEDLLHNESITRHLLLVPAGEGLCFQAPKQGFHFPVR